MEKPDADEVFLELLPDYVNNVLPPDQRHLVEDYLKRSPTGQQALRNLQLLFETMEQLPPEPAHAGDAARARFIAHARAHPLTPPQPSRREGAPRPWGWLQAALAFCLVVIVGQTATITHLVTVESGETVSRSLSDQRPAVASNAPVLAVEVDPDTPYGELLAALHGIDGRIVSASTVSPVVHVQLGSVPVALAKEKLMRSKAVMGVTELPSDSHAR